MIDALLIYPKLGSMDSMVVDIPLSIIYAASDSVKQGYNIKLIDLRCEDNDWKSALKNHLSKKVLLAGVSVMTGMPLYYAREASLFIKNHYPEIKIVWGGPHCTVLPETINEPFIDFLIRGYGSTSLAELVKLLKSKSNDFSTIHGLSYKQNGQIFHNPSASKFEMLHYADIPYHLIDVTSPHYVRAYSSFQLFPMFTSIGCPYQCSFCLSPATYRVINGKKWLPYPDEEILAHMEYIIKQFGVSHISIIDDTSFPDINRMRRIFNMIIERKIKVTLDFRGARVNEIDRMDDDFINLMIKAGGRFLMVGVESASNRLLKTMQKGITKEQILRVNRKLAQFPELIPHYNFIYGTPGETYDDLVETKDVVLELLKDNPNAYFGFGGDWKPIPGSKMLETAEKQFNYKAPQTLNDWIEIDSSDANSKIVHSWYTRRQNNMIKLMQISSFAIDNKLIKESSPNKSAMFKILRFLSRYYKPIAMIRLRFNLHHFMIEYYIYLLMVKIMRNLKST